MKNNRTYYVIDIQNKTVIATFQTNDIIEKREWYLDLKKTVVGNPRRFKIVSELV